MKCATSKTFFDTCNPCTTATTLAIAMILTAKVALADHGDDHVWINPAGGDFENAANWDPDVPVVEDPVRFNLDATYTVDFNQNHENGHLRMRDGDVTFLLNGHTYTLRRFQFSGTNPVIEIGHSAGDDAVLRILDGTLLASVNGTTSVVSRIGVNTGSMGTVYVTGADARFHPRSLHLGFGGDGALVVSGGGLLGHPTSLNNSARIAHETGSSAEMIISGDGSRARLTAFDIGWRGPADVTVEDGGFILCTSLRLGGGATGGTADGDGMLTITGAGSSIRAGTATGQWPRIGGHGDGTIIVEQGGEAEFLAGVVLGWAAGHGEVIVRDPGSNWIAPGAVRVGQNGTGEMSVLAGAAASTGNVEVGRNSDAFGAVTASGAGSMWQASSVYLGGSNNNPGGTGSLTIGPGATVSVNNTFKMWEGEGNTLTFTLAGPTACSGFGFLDVGGTIDLQGAKGSAGTLEIVLDDGYEPLDGHAFTLFFDFDSIEGAFDEIVLPELAAGLEWNLGDLYTTGVISVGDAAPPCPSDINHDGVVDGSDLLILLGGWGECPPGELCTADINCDGVVDGSDLLILLGQWGMCP